jgi:hypothetical protein
MARWTQPIYHDINQVKDGKITLVLAIQTAKKIITATAIGKL